MGSSPAPKKGFIERLSARSITTIIVTLLLAGSCGLLAWGLWPVPRRSQGFTLAADRFPALGGQAYRLTLDYPPRLRPGEVGTVTLRLDPLTGEPPAPAAAGETGHRVFEGRLELAGLAPVERQTVETPLLPGLAAEVSWTVQGWQAGQVEGTAWSYLDVIPAAGGERQPAPVGAQGIAIEIVSLFGLSQAGALGLGGAGAGIGAAGLVWIGLKKGHPA